MIKICKALNRSFWVIFRRCFVLAFDSNPTCTLALPHKTRERGRSLLPAVLMYTRVLESSSKCFFSLTGLPHPSGFPSFSPPTRVRCSHLSYRNKATRHRRRRATNLRPHAVASERLQPWGPGAHAWLWGPGGLQAGRRPSPAPGGDVEAGDHPQVGLAEVDAAF